MRKSESSGRITGFSLPEVMLALGVFTMAIVACMAILSSSVQGLHVVDSRDNAIRLTAALEDSLRAKTLVQVYEWLKQDKPLYAYSYLASSTEVLGDGQPKPVSQSDSLGQIRLIPSLRAQDDIRLTQETAARSGQIYRVILDLSKANPENPLPETAEDYLEAVLVVHARFYVVPDTSAGLPSSLPIHSCTVSYTVQ